MKNGLPDQLRGRFAELGGRTVIDATTSRRTWSGTDGQTLLDFGSTLFQYIIEQATSPEFGGGYAAVPQETLQGDLLAAFLCRWQNDQGQRLDQQLVVVRKSANTIEIADGAVADLFEKPVVTLTPTPLDAKIRKEVLDATKDRVEIDMAEAVTRFRHPNDLILLAVAENGL